MIKALSIFGLFLVGVTNQSCVLVNTTKGQESQCTVHDIKMKKTVVKTQYGLIDIPPTYFTIPNPKKPCSMGCVVPRWPVRRLALIYHCRICDSLYQKEYKGTLP